MSDEETQVVEAVEGQMLTAEYKDGQLQIVEVTPFDKSDGQNTDGSSEQTKYLQVLDSGNGKGLVQLDLLNFTLVKCEDGENQYQVVTNSSEDGETTLTCVLSTEDSEDNDNQDSYVVVNTVEGQDPLVFLQSSLQQINTQQSLRNDGSMKKPLTSAEILEKAKALQKAKALLLRENTTRSSTRGRKRKSLPPPMELLSSPNFKLYLYSCKLCNFKCNAVKEMSMHKATQHAAGKSRGGGPGGRSAVLQCARCPYRGTLHSQLMKHVQSEHFAPKQKKYAMLPADSMAEEPVELDSTEADVLVCGACGFESSDKLVFQHHIHTEHGVNVLLHGAVLSIDDSSQSN